MSTPDLSKVTKEELWGIIVEFASIISQSDALEDVETHPDALDRYVRLSGQHWIVFGYDEYWQYLPAPDFLKLFPTHRDFDSSGFDGFTHINKPDGWTWPAEEKETAPTS